MLRPENISRELLNVKMRRHERLSSLKLDKDRKTTDYSVGSQCSSTISNELRTIQTSLGNP